MMMDVAAVRSVLSAHHGRTLDVVDAAAVPQKGGAHFRHIVHILRLH